MNQSRWNLAQNIAITVFILLVYAWAWKGLKIDSSILDNSLNYIQVFLADFYPPNWSVLDIAIKALIETIQMSIIGTTLGQFFPCRSRSPAPTICLLVGYGGARIYCKMRCVLFLRLCWP